MAKFHVNLATGEVGACKAQVRCPFGDMVVDHFDSPELARDAYERIMENESFSSLSKIQADHLDEGLRVANAGGLSMYSQMYGNRAPGRYFESVRVFSGNTAGGDLLASVTGKSMKDTVRDAVARAAYVTKASAASEKASRDLSNARALLENPAFTTPQANQGKVKLVRDAVAASKSGRVNYDSSKVLAFATPAKQGTIDTTAEALRIAGRSSAPRNYNKPDLNRAFSAGLASLRG